MAKRNPAHVTLRVKLYMHTKFKICSSKDFSGQIPYLAISCYHGNHFRNFSPCFKLGLNLSPCQVSEKTTYKFDHNDGTNILTNRQIDIQTSPLIYIYIYIYIYRKYKYVYIYIVVVVGSGKEEVLYSHHHAFKFFK